MNLKKLLPVAFIFLVSNIYAWGNDSDCRYCDQGGSIGQGMLEGARAGQIIRNVGYDFVSCWHISQIKI